MISALKAATPWQLKIVAKVILSRLPVPYTVWRNLGLFRDGAMDEPAAALEIFRTALAQAGRGPSIDGLTVLELGPGDALSSAIIAFAFGAKGSALVDVRKHAMRDPAKYRPLLDRLEAEGFAVKHLFGARTLAALLNLCSSNYLTNGLSSLEHIAPQSIDFAFSNAVLEHVRAHEFLPVMRAFKRTLAKTAISFHRVDLSDHLSFALNNLRFSTAVWESALMAGSGFYTNRIRMRTMLDLFAQAELAAQVVTVRRFDRLPTPREKLARDFRDLPEDELRISGFDVLLTPA